MSDTRQISILFITADPTNASRLRLGQEMRDIQDRLSLAKLRDSFKFSARMAVRPADITQAIFDTDPQIVHFSGHGTNVGDLCFEDERGMIAKVSSDALASLFSLLSKQVQCVVLNACYSEVQARAIAKHIPFVIGMRKEIGDRAAIAFASGFYKAIAAGKSVEDSFSFGVVELKLLGIKEDLTPTLVSGGELPHWVKASDSIKRDRWQKTHLSIETPGGVNPSQYSLLEPAAYSSVQAILDQVFVDCIADAVAPFSYGSEWLFLGGGHHDEILVPWEWVGTGGPISLQAHSGWLMSKPEDAGLTPGSSWRIATAQGPLTHYFTGATKNANRVATNSDYVAQIVRNHPKGLALLLRDCLKQVPAADVDSKAFAHRIVLRNWLGLKLQGLVVIDGDEKFDPSDPRMKHYLRFFGARW